MASQIGDHMPEARFEVYADAFRAASLLRDYQFRFRDDYSVAMTGRFALPPDTKTTADGLAAVERMRAYMRVGRASAANAIVSSVETQLGVTPDPAIVEVLRRKAEKCLAILGQPQN